MTHSASAPSMITACIFTQLVCAICPCVWHCRVGRRVWCCGKHVVRRAVFGTMRTSNSPDPSSTPHGFRAAHLSTIRSHLPRSSLSRQQAMMKRPAAVGVGPRPSGLPLPQGVTATASGEPECKEERSSGDSSTPVSGHACTTALEERLVLRSVAGASTAAMASSAPAVRLSSAPTSQPRGRGRGRPKKQPVALAPSCRKPEQLALVQQSAPNRATAVVVREPTAPPMALHVWLGPSATLEGASRQAKIPHGVSGIGQPRPIAGFTPELPDTPAVAAVAALRDQGTQDEWDEDVSKIVRFCMGEQRPPVVSLEALSLLLLVDRKRVPSLFYRCAAALTMLCHARQKRLELAIVDALPRSALVHYIECVQYDETELRTRIVGDPKAPGLAMRVSTSSSLPLGDAGRHVGADSQSAHTQLSKVSASQALQRIMQTQGEIGMVLQLRDKMVTISYRSPCPLSVLERTSASCVMHQQLCASRATRASNAFAGMTRATTTDGAASNLACEAALACGRSPTDGQGLHLVCDIHCTALVYEKVLAPVDSELSGAIRVAKSLRTGSAMTRFRQCLRDEIASRLRILVGSPPRSAIAYKKAALQLFASHGAGAPKRRALLALFPNGEWRSPDVEVYVRPGTAPEFTEPAMVLDRVTNGLMAALASSQPSMYNRSKWTGSDLAIDDLAIFECVHRLLSTTFLRFCATYLSGARAARLHSLATACRVYSAACLADDEEQDEATAMAASCPVPGGRAVPSGQFPPADGTTPAAAADGGVPEWAATNAKDRSSAMALLLRRPLGHFVLIRLVMEPLRQYMANQFRIASEGFGVEEKAKLAKALQEGGSYAPKMRVLELAEGVADQRFFHTLSWLLGEKELWGLMPPPDHTVSMRALAFRCIARMGCAFAKLLATRHRKFPYQIFRLLREPGLAAEFRQVPECLLDPWTRRLRQKWPSLEGSAFLQVLYTTASMMRVDVSHIEARHASIRRFLTSGSVQTHTVSLPLLSAQWLFQQYRTTRQRCRPSQQGKKVANMTRRSFSTMPVKKKLKPGERDAAQRSGFGGPWRAWVRRFTSRRAFKDLDLSAEGERFRAARDVGAPEYQEACVLGQAATLRGKLGAKHGFGGTARSSEKARRALRRLCPVLDAESRTSTADPATTAMVLVERSIASGATVAQTLAAANYQKRAEAMYANQLEESLHKALSDYEAGPGAALVSEVQAFCPALASVPLVGEPTVFGHHCRMELPSTEDIEQVTGWACAHAHGSGLAVRLEEQWSQLHRTIMDPGKSLPSAGAASNKCFAAGACTCSAEGVELEKRVIRLLNYIKFMCKARANFRRDLAEGFLVLRLLTRPTCDDEPVGESDGHADLWLHIGLMYFSPYEPSFMHVEPVASVPGEVPADTRRVYIRSMGEFPSLRSAIGPLRGASTISAKWYRIEEAARPIAEFLPQPVPALLLPGFADAQQFWPRRQPMARSKASAGPDAGGGLEDVFAEAPVAQADEGEEAEPEAEDEDAPPEFVAMLDPLLDAYDETAPEGLSVPASSSHEPGNRPMAEENADPPQPPPPAPPTPPELPPAEKRRRQGRFRALEQTITVEGGTITYYASNNNFEARCFAHYGERCTLTRTAAATASARSSGPLPGRPLGLLASWLLVGSLCEDKRTHKDAGNLKRLASATCFEYRKADRQTLMAAHGAQELAAHERPAADGEGEEPEAVE